MLKLVRVNMENLEILEMPETRRIETVTERVERILLDDSSHDEKLQALVAIIEGERWAGMEKILERLGEEL